jgi:ribonuclease HI
VLLRSDSQYVVQNFPKLGQWAADGTLAGEKARGNADLWSALLEASRPHLVVVEWIRGHADCVEQNHCHDRARSLALQEAAQVAA